MMLLRLKRLSFLSYTSASKKKLNFFINIIIFISLFALSSALISLTFENKIDKIDNLLIQEEINQIVIDNQIITTPVRLKDIEVIINQEFTISNYTDIINTIQDKDELIVTGRDTYFNTFYNFHYLSKELLFDISKTVSDAILIIGNNSDVNFIQKKQGDYKFIDDEFWKIDRKRQLIENEYTLKSTQELENGTESDDSKTEYYLSFKSLKDQSLDLLNKQSDFFKDFTLEYFQKKRIESQKISQDYQIKLEKLANQESKLILIAFLLQLLIFLSTQYFEFSIEGSNRDEKSKKKK